MICSIGQVSRVPSHDGELSFNCVCMFNAFLVYFLRKSVTAFDIRRPYGVLMVCVCVGVCVWVCVCVCVCVCMRVRVRERQTDREEGGESIY